MKHLASFRIGNSKSFFVAIALTLFTSTLVQAQLVGYSAELDTMFLDMDEGDPLEALEYHGVYNVYANLTNPDDVVSSVYSDVDALGNPPMGIDAPCGCIDPAQTSIVVGASNNPAFFASFPEYEYDSFWTIGMETSQDEGQLPSQVNMGEPSGLCAGYGITNGSLYITGSTDNWPANAVAGDDLKVLIARVTTCGDFSLQACVQVFVGGSQDSVNTQRICPEPLMVALQGCTDADACNYNPNATTDDGNCTFQDGIYGCDGECLADADGDGICDELEVPGCTDDDACNFDQAATDDDGSCVFPGDLCDDGNPLTYEDEIQGCECQGYSCHEVDACNFSLDGIEDRVLARIAVRPAARAGMGIGAMAITAALVMGIFGAGVPAKEASAASLSPLGPVSPLPLLRCSLASHERAHPLPAWGPRVLHRGNHWRVRRASANPGACAAGIGAARRAASQAGAGC